MGDDGRAATAAVGADDLDDAAPPPPEHLALAAEFPAADRATWSAGVDAVLIKSGRLEAGHEPGAGVAALTRRTVDGIAVAPLYTAPQDGPDGSDDARADDGGDGRGEPGRYPFVRGSRRPDPDAVGAGAAGWEVRQAHDGTGSPAAVREAILADLENGVGAIWLAVGPSGVAVADLSTVLDGVLLDIAPVTLEARSAAAAGDSAAASAAAAADDDTDIALAAAAAFLDHAAGTGVDPAELRATLGLDPIGQRARTGAGPGVEVILPLVRRVALHHPLVRPIVVDTLPVHLAGGSPAQELGWSLAAGVAYLRAMVEDGHDVAAAARMLEFRLPAGVEQFPTIAALRAARALWARVLTACGVAADVQPGQHQHAVASPVMLTRRDPYVNLLRGTVAAFAAGVGGADAVTVAPFDAGIATAAPIGVAGAFSRRIARNTQSLLTDEAHLARVADPAGGSWFVESLTAQLATAGWAFFQEIENAGGALAVCGATGWLAQRIAPVREQRAHTVAIRATPITGVSEFPDLAEAAVLTAPPPAPRGGGLPVWRASAAFEERRDRSDAALAATGARPAVFLATLGPLAAHATRAGFVRSLLACGGIDALEAGPTADPAAVAAAYRADGDRRPPAVAVLCGTDRAYAGRDPGFAGDGADTAAALRAAGARHVLLAGRAEVAGVGGHLAAGADVLAAIDALYRALADTADTADTDTDADDADADADTDTDTDAADTAAVTDTADSASPGPQEAPR